MNIFSFWASEKNELYKMNKEDFKQEQYNASLLILQVFAGLLVLSGLILISLWKSSPSSEQLHLGYLYRNYLYYILIPVQVIFLLFCRWQNKAMVNRFTFIHKAALMLEMTFLLCWAASISSVDQLIHGDIIVYMMVCYAAAVATRFSPLQFLAAYAISLTFFLLGIAYFQSDFERLVAQYINGTISVLVAYSISLVFYRLRVRDFVSRKTVEQQKNEMEQRVIERTADLAAANEELQAEVIERKAAEEKMAYFSLHDALTGLYNRTYFEEEMRRLSFERTGNVGIIMCDVDGLKLINDSMGHDNGDSLLLATANIIKSCFRSNDVVARVGGDEFSILLPNCTPEILESTYNRLQQSANQSELSWQGIPLSLSIGTAIRTNPSVPLTDIYKEADNNMYRQKLYRSQSARSAIVQTLMKALEARDFITEGHAERLQVMVGDLGVKLGLSGRNIVDLRLFAQFHDIGKVGLPDRILFKPEALTPEERKEMQRHSEMGHRIALSSPDLVHIADWILKHHEWWNGSGYPLGLAQYDIPLECRILAVADAYDAMTSNRPYRKAMSHDDAVAELKRCAGIQFDPYLIEQFIEMLEQKKLTGADN
ncbi:MAG TPA: diguanylate cyclase [Syntrophomonadaceae bacterium]|nr:diguanylate cyclase [Syntrophomonadaceae bacterium]HPR92662.1 diguanylate cyclase [Syntrophomonadaceae bacterium]